MLSRAIAIPVYLRQLGMLTIDESWDSYLNAGSKFLLFASGIAGTLIILYNVVRAYLQRRRIKKSLDFSGAPAAQES